MPRFLGFGDSSEWPLLIPLSAFDSSHFFFRVVKDDRKVSFDSENHGPIIVLQYSPNYPAELVRERIEGDVTVEFNIGVDGKVYEPEVVDSSDERFNKEVLDTIKYWRFLPPTENGVRKAARARQMFPFIISVSR